jgi:Ca-activated chloride channel family protein
MHHNFISAFMEIGTMKFQPLVPLWLLALYTIAVLAFAGWYFWRIRTKLNKLLKERARLKRLLRRAALLFMPIIFALGPSVQGDVTSPGISNLDVIAAVDTTPSMGAVDYAGTSQRIEGVKHDLLALSQKLEGAHMEIVAFDSEANVILPSTTDVTAFTAALQNLTPQISSYSQGSSIDKPISLIANELKNSKTNFPDRYRLLFYMGDGEQTADTQVKSFGSLSQYLDGGAVLGYGTANGAQIIKYTGLGSSDENASYITTIDKLTNTLKPAISSMDATALQKIAAEIKVPYIDRNKGGAGNIYQESKVNLAIDRSQHVVHYLNLYWLFAIPYVVLIFWEWQILMFKLLEMRKPRRGKHA